jgi:hypothetical protein
VVEPTQDPNPRFNIDLLFMTDFFLSGRRPVRIEMPEVSRHKV